AGAAVILLSPSDRVPLAPRRRMRRLRGRCPGRTLGDRASRIGATRSPTRDPLLPMALSVALSMAWVLLLAPGCPFESKRPLVQQLAGGRPEADGRVYAAYESLWRPDERLVQCANNYCPAGQWGKTAQGEVAALRKAADGDGLSIARMLHGN